MAGFSKVTVMVVDDNRTMRSLVRAILNSVGINNIIEASSGRSALTKLRDNECHLIILDWAMDDMDGIEFTEYLRNDKDSPDPFVPILMLTGHTERMKVERARDAGIDEFIAKPVTAKQLLMRIDLLVHKRRSFVRTEEYFGPDRRRRRIDYDGPDKRS